MKWIYRIQQKTKPAILLMVVVAIIIGSSFIEKRFFTEINKSVSSIYNDRLIPAAELFHANDIMYKKRLILEKYLVNPSLQDAGFVKQQLAGYNAQLDSIIGAFETSYLVVEESRSFKHFKRKVNQYNQLENLCLAGTEGLALPNAYENKLGNLFKEIHQELVLLSNIQTTEGRELLKGSKVINGSASLISDLQIAVVLVITLVVYALLLSSNKLLPKNLKNFRLN